MSKILIKLKKLKVSKINIAKNLAELKIEFAENGKLDSIEKNFDLGESSLLFAKNVLKEIKSLSKMRYNMNFNEPYNNYVNVLLDEGEEGDTEERLTNGLNRVKEKVRSFKNIKSHNNYMDKLFEINTLSIEFK